MITLGRMLIFTKHFVRLLSYINNNRILYIYMIGKGTSGNGGFAFFLFAFQAQQFVNSNQMAQSWAVAL